MPEDQQAKYLFMEDLAVRVALIDATAVVLIADVWYLRDVKDLEPGKRAGESKARREALEVTAMKSDGSTLTLIAPLQQTR